MSTNVVNHVGESKPRTQFRLIVNSDFNEPNSFAAVAKDNAASKFAHSLKLEHEVRGRDRSKPIHIKQLPDDSVVNAASEILFGMGYYANIIAASKTGNDGYAFLTRRESSFECW